MPLLLAAACSDGEPTTTGTIPRTWDGDFLVDRVILDCDGVDEWTYDVWTLGWGELVTVDVVARDAGLRWVEHHGLEEVGFGEDWAHFRVTLDQATSEEEYAPSEATWIACEAKSYVTWAIGAWAYGGDLSECIAYGVDPVGTFPDCANWGQGH